jgi:hypothetical protein
VSDALARAPEFVVDVENSSARIAKNRIDALGYECLDEHLGACRHVGKLILGYVPEAVIDVLSCNHKQGSATLAFIGRVCTIYSFKIIINLIH